VVDGKLIVEKGLGAGEQIVVHGINKVYHGSLVTTQSLQDYEAELAREEQAALDGAMAEDPAG